MSVTPFGATGQHDSFAYPVSGDFLTREGVILNQGRLVDLTLDAEAAAAAQARQNAALARAAAARFEALGPNAKSSTGAKRPGFRSRPEARPASALVRRFALQSGARQLLRDERVAKCCRTRFSDLIHIKHHSGLGQSGDGWASYSGLVTCASVWMCPVCCAKVGERRRQECDRGIQVHEQQGGRVLMVTFTIRHKRHQRLKPLLKGLKKAHGMLVSSGWATRFKAKYGLLGRIRALEVTHGRHGWHPHIHELLFVAGGVNPQEVQRDLRKRWAEVVQASGMDCNDFGCKVSYASSAEGCMSAAQYLLKFDRERAWTPGCELTKCAQKKGKNGLNPFELLEAFVFDGDEVAGKLFEEYGRAFKSSRQCYWSPGLKKALGVAEKSDEELSEEETAGGTLLVSLSGEEWRAVVANDCRAELLEVACSGKVSDISAYLFALGIWKPTGFS